MFPSLLIASASPNAVFTVDPSAVTPVKVCVSVNVFAELPSDPDRTNISTLPALPGAIELTANMSPLSLACTLCPNLCPLPPAGASSV